MNSSSFQTGDRVVLPPYGVGVVCGTCQRPIAGETQAYYQVEFPNTSSRAFVPVSAPQGAGLRAALTDADMPDLLHRLQNSRDLNLPRQWSARHRRVSEILAAADPYELATLTCELRRWNVQRGLPDLDRQAFRQAIRLLEQEVRGLNNEHAQNVQQFLGHAWNETSEG